MPSTWQISWQAVLRYLYNKIFASSGHPWELRRLGLWSFFAMLNPWSDAALSTMIVLDWIEVESRGTFLGICKFYSSWVVPIVLLLPRGLIELVSNYVRFWPSFEIMSMSKLAVSGFFASLRCDDCLWNWLFCFCVVNTTLLLESRQSESRLMSTWGVSFRVWSFRVFKLV